MDWTDLSNRLAEGAKVYKAFKDGADAASMLGGFERAHAELSAQYEAIQAQVEQAKAAAQTAKDDATRAQTRAQQDIARRQAEFDAVHAKQVAAAEDTLEAWKKKTDLQASNYAAEAASWKSQIEALTSQAGQLDTQVQSLIRVRDALKAQLQSAV